MDAYLFQKINPVKDFISFASSLDTRIFNGVNQLALKWLYLDTLGIYFAEYFEYVLIFCLILPALYRVCSGAGFLLKFKKYWKMVFQAVISAVLARFVIVEFIRFLWQRPRPFTLQNFAPQNLGGLIENNVNLLINYPDKTSFPSGHAAFFFALSTIVYFYNKKIGILFYLGSFLICLARVFVGIHWPSDILAGAVVGVFSGWLAYKVFKVFRKF